MFKLLITGAIIERKRANTEGEQEVRRGI